MISKEQRHFRMSKSRSETLFCHTLQRSENPRRVLLHLKIERRILLRQTIKYKTTRDAKGSKRSKPEGRKNGQTIFLEMPSGQRASERCPRYVSSPEYAIENQFPPNERETKQSMWILNINICSDNKRTQHRQQKFRGDTCLFHLYLDEFYACTRNQNIQRVHTWR